MEWGDKETWLLQACDGQVPLAILNKPEIRMEHKIILEAFFILNSCRQMGYSVPQPLTLSDIKSYLEIYEPPQDIQAFIEFIKHLDSIYLSRVSKENDRRTNKGKHIKP